MYVHVQINGCRLQDSRCGSPPHVQTYLRVRSYQILFRHKYGGRLMRRQIGNENEMNRHVSTNETNCLSSLYSKVSNISADLQLRYHWSGVR